MYIGLVTSTVLLEYFHQQFWNNLSSSMARFIDSHAHLFDKDFDKDLPEVIARARESGVLGVLINSIRPDDFQDVLRLSEQYPDFCLPCFGVHPVQGEPPESQRSAVKEDLEKALPLIHEHHDKLVAIGEVGLDFSPRFCTAPDSKDLQRLVLKEQIKLAKQYDLPLNVHSRSAGRPTIELLKQCGAEKVLMHAFDGRAAVAMEGVKLGYYFSIPPSIIRSEQQKLVERIPIENLLLETDSPSLGPIKQERNEPCNISIGCEYIAKIKKLEPGHVAQIVLENTLKLFPKITNYVVKLR